MEFIVSKAAIRGTLLIMNKLGILCRRSKPYKRPSEYVMTDSADCGQRVNIMVMRVHSDM